MVCFDTAREAIRKDKEGIFLVGFNSGMLLFETAMMPPLRRLWLGPYRSLRSGRGRFVFNAARHLAFCQAEKSHYSPLVKFQMHPAAPSSTDRTSAAARRLPDHFGSHLEDFGSHLEDFGSRCPCFMVGLFGAAANKKAAPGLGTGGKTKPERRHGAGRCGSQRQPAPKQNQATWG